MELQAVTSKQLTCLTLNVELQVFEDKWELVKSNINIVLRVNAITKKTLCIHFINRKKFLPSQA